MLYISYKNSVLASIVSLLGELVLIFGVIMAFTGLILPGVLFAGVGGLVMFGARQISRKKAEREERNFK